MCKVGVRDKNHRVAQTLKILTTSVLGAPFELFYFYIK
jgi:hypothetical protein